MTSVPGKPGTYTDGEVFRSTEEANAKHGDKYRNIKIEEGGSLTVGNTFTPKGIVVHPGVTAEEMALLFGATGANSQTLAKK